MKKILLITMLSLMTLTSVMAQDVNDANYQTALAAITDGGIYRIKTNVSGTDYYVTTGGTLTSVKDNAGYFTITMTSGGFFGTGFRIDSGTDRFTNPPLTNNVANLKPGSFSHSTGDRADWERQILYQNGEGKFAIRSCNCADGTSSWNDAARTHWTYYMVGETVTPCYSYDKAYIWDFESPQSPLKYVNVTYKLVESDGTTVVSSTTKKQVANSALITPLPGTGVDYNGFFHEKFYYDYTTTDVIGDTDCTITITRTEKTGVVKALTDLSNSKAYHIGCDRGAMIAYNGSMVSTALNNVVVNTQPLSKFAVISYEGRYYLYSVNDSKFVINTGALVDNLTNDGHGEKDAIVMTKQTAPYFLWRFNTDNAYINTNGNTPLGYVINSWSTPDLGNQYYMVEADDFDPTAALQTLKNDFNPEYTVTYVIKDDFGKVLFTSEPQITKSGARITTLPSDFHRRYYTYNTVDVTIADFKTTIEFIATWNGPFEISTDFATAHWYNMAMRGSWYVTSAIKGSDGAYKSQETNTGGYLIEDSYQWAFIGNGYDGFKIINKAEGNGKSFGWTDAQQTNAGVPTVMDDSIGHHAWDIVPSTNTSVPAGSFCLNVPGTYLYVNQYGGAGGSIKFWNSTGNVSDAGSAFTVFDVPNSVIDDEDWTILQIAYSEMDNGKGWNREWTFDTESHSLSGLVGVKFSNGHVTSIDLSSNNLTGAFPFAVLSLPYLETLNVSGNQLAGDIGLMMTAFKQKNPATAIALQNLNISDNNLSGNIGLFANCFTNLKSLDASGNCLEDVYPMIPATVTSLDISRQTISRVVPLHFANLLTEDIATKLPSILLYDHKNQTFKNNINLLYTIPDGSWNMTLNYQDGQLSTSSASGKNIYYGESGDTLNVALLYSNGRREGSTFRIALFFDKGDDNFDGQVDILDLQTDILYIMEKYQERPYNFTAANLWNDDLVNVQDIIRLVNLLMDMESVEQASSARRKAEGLKATSDASVYVKDGQLMLNSSEPVAALDIFLAGASKISLAYDLERTGISVITKKESDGLHIIAYSMSDACIPSGISIIGMIDPDAAIVRSVMLSDCNANAIPVSIEDDATGIESLNVADTDHQAIFDLQGRRIKTMSNKGIYIKNGHKIAK